MNWVNSLEEFAALLSRRMRSTLTASNGSNSLARLEAKEVIPTGDWDRDFNQLAIELFTLQFNRNDAYRKLCEARGTTPAGVRIWTHIPAVPAAAFKEMELSCIPASERTSVFYSSGTTEHRPSRHFHHERSLKLYETSLVAAFKLAVTSGSIHESVGLALTPNKAEAPNSSLVHMFDTLRRELGLAGFEFTGRIPQEGGWLLDCPATVGFLEKAIQSGAPILLFGTAFSYVHLLDYLADQGSCLRLPPGSRVLETGGYKGRSRALTKSELHSLISSRLGVPASQILCEYGMSELSSQAYTIEEPPAQYPNADRSTDALCFRFPPWAKVQIISPEDGHPVAEGETGLIRVCDLSNVYSVMSIQTEDLAVCRRSGFELAGRAARSESRGCSLMAVN